MNPHMKLFISVLVSGVLAAFSYSNNVSVSRYVNDNILNKKDNYVSPYGPKINKEWVQNWEVDRTK
jgi:hypothetical protein